MTQDVRYEVWVDKPYRPCRRACAHCNQRKGTRRAYVGRYIHSAAELVAWLHLHGRGRRIRIAHWYDRQLKCRLVRVLVEFRNRTEPR